MSWSHLVDELCNDPLLSHLDEASTHSVIRILSLTLYADAEAGLMEQVEFERMIGKLPWFESKEETVREFIEEAKIVAADIHDESAFHSAVEGAATVLKAAKDAAKKLEEPRDIRHYVFSMAATLAAIDGTIHEHEQHTLSWLAHAFGIDEAAAQRLVETALEEHS